jgi:Right handed beta helix region
VNVRLRSFIAKGFSPGGGLTIDTLLDRVVLEHLSAGTTLRVRNELAGTVVISNDLAGHVQVGNWRMGRLVIGGNFTGSITTGGSNGDSVPTGSAFGCMANVKDEVSPHFLVIGGSSDNLRADNMSLKPVGHPSFPEPSAGAWPIQRGAGQAAPATLGLRGLVLGYRVLVNIHYAVLSRLLSAYLIQLAHCFLILGVRGMLSCLLAEEQRKKASAGLKMMLHSTRNRFAGVLERVLPNEAPGGIIFVVPCVIRRPGCYRLEHDLVYSGSSGTAIEVAAHDVTIDLQGFSLRNSAGLDTCATGIGGTGLTGVTITNGTVRGFRYGIFLQNGKKYRIMNIRAEESGQWGMSVEGQDCVIRDNVVLNCGGSRASCSRVCIAMRLFGARLTVEKNILLGLRRSPGNSEWVGVHFDFAPRTLFANNIIVAAAREPDTWGLWVNGGQWADAGRTDVLMKKNLFVNLETAASFVDYATGTCSHNLLLNVVNSFLLGGPDAAVRNGGGNVVAPGVPIPATFERFKTKKSPKGSSTK